MKGEWFSTHRSDCHAAIAPYSPQPVWQELSSLGTLVGKYGPPVDRAPRPITFHQRCVAQQFLALVLLIVLLPHALPFPHLTTTLPPYNTPTASALHLLQAQFTAPHSLHLRKPTLIHQLASFPTATRLPQHSAFLCLPSLVTVPVAPPSKRPLPTLLR
jgi:hypothetical protein